MTIRDKIGEQVKNGGTWNNATLAQAVGAPEPSVRRETAALVKEGLLVKTGRTFTLNTAA